MKKVVFAALAVIFLVPVAIWGYGNYAIYIGKKEASWILSDMWGEYFGLRSTNLQDFEEKYLESLSYGAGKNQSLINFVVGNKCYDSTWRCAVIMTSASNLMLDADVDRVGLRGAVEAYERVRGQCSVMYESSVLLYHIKHLSDGGMAKANTLLRKIRKNGGIMSDMRTPECKRLASERPEYFASYALLVAKVMAISGGRNAYVAAYIQSLKDKRRVSYE